MECVSERVLFFTSETSCELQVACFSPSTSPLELKELFRAVAQAGPSDVLKLVSWSGQLVNICPSLPSNCREQPYRLVVVAAPTEGMLLSGTEVDLLSLEERVASLEHQLQAECGHLPPAVSELKSRVEDFRVKLEATEHLSWLGFHKSSAAPLFTEPRRALRCVDLHRQKVRDRFFNICDVAVSEDVRQRLRQPSFDCCQWDDEEVLLLLQQMFLDLDLLGKFNINLTVLRSFLFEVYNNYNDIPFHNFRHCFCVAQMMYAIMWCVDLPSKIGDLETLILLTSCICHDLDHPGFNNIYQINARTELALRYNDISPLENHHCSVAFRILEEPELNILQSLHGEVYRQVREGIIRCILATDMARHNEILAQFRDITPEFDYSNKAHVNLLSMVLIKVADISNEARPMDVAEPWLDRLLQEFFQQSDAEKLEGLPVTPFMDREKITKPSSQCSFIGFVLLPLFEALGELLGELQVMIVQPVRDALDYYRRLNDAAKDERSHRKSVVEASSSDSMATSGDSMPQSASAHSVRSRRSLPALALRTSSRSSERDDEAAAGEAASVEELPEEDEETATEVEVSEKALKFKISTEGSIGSMGSGRKSYPGSRKGSRDKTLVQDCHVHELARAIRDRDREYRRTESAREYRRVSSASPVSSQGEAECLLEALHEHVATVNKDVCNGAARPEINCICTICRVARHGMPEKHEQAKHGEVRDDKDLREQVGETVSCCLDSCRGYGEYRSGSIYDQSDENGAGTMCQSKCPQDAILGSEYTVMDIGKAGVNQHHKASILSRIRSFADRISFSSSNEKDGNGKSKHNHLMKSPSISIQSSPTTPKYDRRVLKIQSSVRDGSPSTSSLTTVPQSDDGGKAMTLPKVKRTQRQNGNHRGWRLFSAGSKSDMPSSSPELVSDAQLRSPPSNGKKHAPRSKKSTGNMSESSALPDTSTPDPAEEPEDTSSGGGPDGGGLVSGSLDSVLQVKRTDGSKKQGARSKHAVLLARMGRSESDESGCTSPRAHTWMDSLTSSLRQKRTQEQEHCKSNNTLHE